MFRIIQMALSDAFIYRGDLLIFVFSGIVRPIVTLSVWLAVTSSGGKTPLTATEFIQYYILVMLVGVFVGTWSSPFISARIRSGRISPYLIRPLSYLVWDLSQNIGEKIFKFLYLIPITVAILIFTKVYLPIPNMLVFLSVCLSLIAAGLLNYLVDYCVGILAFWINDSRSFGEMLDVAFYMLSGKLVPIAVLPLFWRNMSVYLPFRYVISFPIEIYLSKLTNGEIMIGFLVQFFWLGLVIYIYKTLWRFGVKNYTAVGA